jgi:superfamily I DNA/RNA helicase
MTSTAFINKKKRFDFVLLDEVQDIERAKLLTIKKFAKSLLVAGDFNQQIYNKSININDLVEDLKPIQIDLLEIFRLTSNLYQLATAINPKARIVAGSFHNTNQTSNVKVIEANSRQMEYTFVWTEAHNNSRPGHPSVILFPTHDHIARFADFLADFLHLQSRPPQAYIINGRRNYKGFNQYWQENEVSLMYLGSSYGRLEDSDFRPIVYLMTYHSAKGLDFKNVFIPNLDKSTNFNFSNDKNIDSTANLLFVAATRSRQNLFLSYSERVSHDLIAQIPTSCYDKIFVDDNYYNAPSTILDFL